MVSFGPSVEGESKRGCTEISEACPLLLPNVRMGAERFTIRSFTPHIMVLSTRNILNKLHHKPNSLDTYDGWMVNSSLPDELLCDYVLKLQMKVQVGF
jgi:hypothetical protein